MIKKILSLLLFVSILFCFAACDEENTADKTSSTKSSETYDTLFDTYPSVFVTENITRITFYAYYGQGTGSDVPAENMAEIINWLDSFSIDRNATDDDVLDGTNTYYVEIEYSDGKVIKEGLDIVFIDDTRYLLKKEPYPDCFMEIISKTDYK